MVSDPKQIGSIGFPKTEFLFLLVPWTIYSGQHHHQRPRHRNYPPPTRTTTSQTQSATVPPAPIQHLTGDAASGNTPGNSAKQANENRYTSSQRFRFGDKAKAFVAAAAAPFAKPSPPFPPAICMPRPRGLVYRLPREGGAPLSLPTTQESALPRMSDGIHSLLISLKTPAQLPLNTARISPENDTSSHINSMYRYFVIATIWSRFQLIKMHENIAVNDLLVTKMFLVKIYCSWSKFTEEACLRFHESKWALTMRIFDATLCCWDGLEYLQSNTDQKHLSLKSKISPDSAEHETRSRNSMTSPLPSRGITLANEDNLIRSFFATYAHS